VPTVTEVGRRVSFTDLKRLAVQWLPRKSHLRVLILAEHDLQSHGEALPKLEIFVKLLREELADP
jgi:hypothetical protein